MNSQRVADVMQGKPDFNEEGAEFWITGPFEDGIAWVGRFSGESPWERHPGDEYLYVREGTVVITLLVDDQEPREVTLEQGSYFVVPKNTWHRQNSTGTVVEIGATPGKTDHSELPDPRLATGSD